MCERWPPPPQNLHLGQSVTPVRCRFCWKCWNWSKTARRGTCGDGDKVGGGEEEVDEGPEDDVEDKDGNESFLFKEDGGAVAEEAMPGGDVAGGSTAMRIISEREGWRGARRGPPPGVTGTAHTMQ